MQFSGTIPKGKNEIKFHNRSEYQRFVDSLAHSEKDVRLTITIEKTKKKRSLSQNGFYWLCIGIIVETMVDMRYERETTTKEAVHDMLREMFNYKEIVNETTGEIAKLPLSTSGMSTTDFMAYMENVKRWCAEWLNLVLPEPNEQLTIDTE